jgi:hypothetical protein
MALAHFQRTFTDASGNIKPGLSVTVRRESDNGLAALFADAGSVTPKSNPFNTDANGHGSFYVVDGRYRIQATDIDWRNLDIVSVSLAGATFTGDIAAPKITASTGILFGTDTAAANTLDDYETGTWTATVSSQLNISGVSIDVEEYTKIGNMVFAQIKGTFSVTSGAGVRTLFAFTLPFLQDGVFAGGGSVRPPSNLPLNPAIDDPVSTSAGTSRLSFISYESGVHKFNIGIHYRGV